jgi:hypothetical protein
LDSSPYCILAIHPTPTTGSRVARYHLMANKYGVQWTPVRALPLVPKARIWSTYCSSKDGDGDGDGDRINGDGYDTMYECIDWLPSLCNPPFVVAETHAAILQLCDSAIVWFCNYAIMQFCNPVIL